MEPINYKSENILILALAGSILSGAWLAYKLKLFKSFSTINDEKKILLPSFLFLLSPFLFPFIFNHNMLSESTAINFFLSGTLGSVITGIFLIINNRSNNKFQLEREEKQRAWQLEREKEQRIWQEESDNRRWDREKTYDSYKKLIQALTNIIQLQADIKDKDEPTDDEYNNFRNLYVEFGSEFTMIMTGHPDKDSKEFEETKAKIFSEALDLDKDSLLARKMITKMMENDSRINIISNT
jgi:hypothetical protein